MKKKKKKSPVWAEDTMVHLELWIKHKTKHWVLKCKLCQKTSEQCHKHDWWNQELSQTDVEKDRSEKEPWRKRNKAIKRSEQKKK